MDVRYCVGCFGCWVKTPGECVSKDGSHDIRREVINSDLVLFASPLIMGFTSALLKKAHDKLIPLIHPYFELVQKLNREENELMIIENKFEAEKQELIIEDSIPQNKA